MSLKIFLRMKRVCTVHNDSVNSTVCVNVEAETVWLKLWSKSVWIGTRKNKRRDGEEKNKGSLLIESAEAWHWDRSEITVCVCTCMSMHCLVCPEWCQIEPPPVFQRHASICWWVCGLGVCTYMINTLACTSDFYAALCGIRYLLCAPVCD